MIEQFLIRQSVLGSVTNMLLSAGTLSSNRSDVTFADSNGVSFGLNTNGVITATVQTNFLTTAMASNRGSDFVQATAGFFGTNASGTIASNAISVSVAAAGAGGSINISAGTTSTNATAFTFSNSNNVSFGINGATITGSIATTYAGTGFTTATTAGTNIVGTLNTSGLSMGVPAYLTTAMQSNAATISNINISAGTTSTNASAFTFSNSNNVSFGINGQTVTGSIATTYAGTGFTTATTAGTAIVGTLNTSGLSLGVPAYLTTAALSQDSSKYAGTGFTTTSTAGSNIVGTLATNGLSMGVPNYLTTAMQSNAATISNIKISAGTLSQTRSDVTFADSNGVSWGLNTNGVVTASIATTYAGTGFTSTTTAGTAIVGTLNTSGLSLGVPAYLTTAGLSSQTFVLSNSQTFYSTGTIAVSEGGGAITIATSVGGQSFMFSVPQTSSLVGVSGVGISTNVSTISVFGTSTGLSYWANLEAFQNTTTTMCQSNSFYVCPLTIGNSIAVSYLRLLGSINFTSTTIATSAVNNATGASTAFSETLALNAVLYTVGSAASSRSLQYSTSASVGFTWGVSVSQASTSNATNQSISQIITYPSEGFSTATASTQYSVSATNGAISTTQWSNLSAQRFIDIPFITTLSAGNYWLALNRISGTVGGKNMDLNITTFGVSQQNLTFGLVNAATNVTNAAPQIGLGLWTTNAAQTTSSIAFANVSATTSYMIPFVQFIRQG